MNPENSSLPESRTPSQRGGEPHAIAEVLAELLAQYQCRFPQGPAERSEIPVAA